MRALQRPASRRTLAGGSPMQARCSGNARLAAAFSSQLARNTSVRASKAYQIESYFRNIENHTQTLSEDLSILAATKEFNAAFQQLQSRALSAEASRALTAYYEKQFLPRLENKAAGSPVLSAYLPSGAASRYPQSQYIASNPYPVGKKQALVAANDGSAYGAVHRRYHPMFRDRVARFGYYDMFLINPQGQIVYTVFKETDYATNLETGPYRDSNLAKLVREVIASKRRGFTQLVDFAAYAPSYGLPASFIAAPIYDGSALVGVLAFQMPVDEINRVMTANQQWQADGLGRCDSCGIVAAECDFV